MQYAGTLIEPLDKMLSRGMFGLKRRKGLFCIVHVLYVRVSVPSKTVPRRAVYQNYQGVRLVVVMHSKQVLVWEDAVLS
jgi:hypothetical protein